MRTIKLRKEDVETSLYIKTREKVFNKLSNEQSMFCCCGQLATSLHENRCQKFNKKVDKETLKEVKGGEK